MPSGSSLTNQLSPPLFLPHGTSTSLTFNPTGHYTRRFNKMVQGLTHNNNLTIWLSRKCMQWKNKNKNPKFSNHELFITECNRELQNHNSPFWFPRRQKSNSTLEYNCAPHSIITNRLFAEKVREKIWEKTWIMNCNSMFPDTKIRFCYLKWVPSLFF